MPVVPPKPKLGAVVDVDAPKVEPPPKGEEAVVLAPKSPVLGAVVLVDPKMFEPVVGAPAVSPPNGVVDVEDAPNSPPVVVPPKVLGVVVAPKEGVALPNPVVVEGAPKAVDGCPKADVVVPVPKVEPPNPVVPVVGAPKVVVVCGAPNVVDG